MSLSPTEPSADLVASLRLAFGSSLRRWRSPRAAPSPEGRRRLDALLILLMIATVVIVAIQADAWTARAVHDLPAPMKAIFGRITYLGLSGYMFTLAGLVLFGAIVARGRGLGLGFDRACLFLAERAGFLIAVLAFSGLASQVVKHLFGRARPPLMDMVGPFHFDMMALKSSYASMPSGHAVSAFAMAVSLGWMAPRLRWPLLTLAVLIAASRVVISAHYPSDVVAGAGLGAASAIMLRRAFALRGLAFRWTPSGLRLRGAGRVWPGLASAFRS
jgi:undecaprenyl-diphosphatase